MRMAVILNKDNSVSCLPMSHSKGYYERKYNVITYVNKLWNPANVLKIKKYFKKQFTN